MYRFAVILALGALAIFHPRSASAETWKPYVCKVFDMPECDAGRKRIFPIPERYSDKETCYREFRKIFESDAALKRKYPQTNNADESYLFGCIKE